jgi:cytochrome c oxidase cbb3-type subunit 2
MSTRNFLLGLSGSFGLAWLFVVVVPFFKMRAIEPIPLAADGEEFAGYYYPKREGRVVDGAKIYAENGCYICHTQLVRPTYAGNDMYRPDAGGLQSDEVRGDTRRETNAFDFAGEKFAQIGLSRMGPDLSNLARRVEVDPNRTVAPEEWLYLHLYDARIFPDRRKSKCPPMPFLFTEQEPYGVSPTGQLRLANRDGKQLVPNADARALVSYLMSLRKDQPVPPSLNFASAGSDAAN